MTGYENYARTGIKTSDPRAIIVLLYEGIINFLNQAHAALDAGDKLAMSDNITRALRIIHHLSSALDFERGDQIAENLSVLYGYMRDALTDANLNCNGAKIDEVADLARPLLEAWRKVAVDPEAAAALKAPRMGVPAPEAFISEAPTPQAAPENSIDVVEQSQPAGEPVVYPAAQKPKPPTNMLAARSAYGM